MSAENSVHLVGRATSDARVTYSTNQKGEQNAIAKFSLAVNKRVGGENRANFINCVAFGARGNFCEKYVKKGVKFVIEGTWESGSYKDSNGNTVYTNECNIDDITFAESKSASQSNSAVSTPNFSAPTANDLPIANNGFQPVGNDVPSFLNVPNDMDLPFPRHPIKRR